MISRYEIKFRLTHEQKLRFLSASLFGLRADPHGCDACYRVTSVYFDSPAFDFYWEKVDGVSIRKKLRLRYYGDAGEGDSIAAFPCFLELKHRVKDTVLKERIRLTAQGARRILDDPQELCRVGDYTASCDLHHRATISTMERLGAQMNFHAANIISYRREAWIGRVDDRLRVTFDYEGKVHDPMDLSTARLSGGAAVIPDGHYVMEVKFNSAFPRWIRDIICQQHLMPRRFSKYAAGIETLRQSQRHSMSHVWNVDSIKAASHAAGGQHAPGDSESLEPASGMPVG